VGQQKDALKILDIMKSGWQGDEAERIDEPVKHREVKEVLEAVRNIVKKECFRNEVKA